MLHHITRVLRTGTTEKLVADVAPPVRIVRKKDGTQTTTSKPPRASTVRFLTDADIQACNLDMNAGLVVRIYGDPIAVDSFAKPKGHLTTMLSGYDDKGQMLFCVPKRKVYVRK